MSTATVNCGGSGDGSSSGSGSGGSSGGCNSSPCGACKFLRRKCVPGCLFAPYFDAEQGAAHFAAVHKIFGASNVTKLLINIPVNKRLDAVLTICYEAQARIRDPVYGCVAHVFALQQQMVTFQAELSCMHAHLSTFGIRPPPPTPPPSFTSLQPLSFPDLPSTSSIPITSYLASLFEQMGHVSWSRVQRPTDPCQYGGPSSSSSTDGGDLQDLARELLLRQGSPQSGPSMLDNDAPPSPSVTK